jgi:lysyl-tRNA synthetase class 2
MFDPADTGLLLAICFDAGGAPQASNQYVPARAIGGYSLDVTRRRGDPDAPDGLADFVIIETIEWMRQRSMRGLALHFATMRAVVAGEDGKGPWRRVERRTLHHFSDTMEIESRRTFNERYEPTWRPRYVVTDSMLNRPRAGLAIARAESVFELPVVGSRPRPHEPAPS